MILLAVAGNLYSVSAYAGAIRVQKGFNDNQITILESVANLGFCIGPWGGWVVDHKGPKAACFCSLVLCTIGFCIAGAVMRSDGGSAGLLIFLFYVMGQGSLFAYMAGISAYQHSPIENQGKALGLLDSMFG